MARSARPTREHDTGARRLAREVALQVLFAMDNPPGDAQDADVALRDYWSNLDGPVAGALDEHQPVRASGRDYGDQIVRGVTTRREFIDTAIRTANPAWRLERMARVDRNILRLAAWEILDGREVPPAVVIDEAIELARRFGSEDSPAFVNGTLDKLARQGGRL